MFASIGVVTFVSNCADKTNNYLKSFVVFLDETPNGIHRSSCFQIQIPHDLFINTSDNAFNIFMSYLIIS